MCSSRKYCYPTPQRGLEFPGGGGFSKTKTFKEMYEAYNNNYWTFEGGGGLTKHLFPRGGVWIFSGTTKSNYAKPLL